MIGKKEITNKPVIEVLENALGGEFLSLDEYDYSKKEVTDSSSLVHKLNIICPHCGWDNKKSPDTSYECVKCMREFQEGEVKDKGFKLDNTDVEQFIDGYRLRIDEKPHQFYEGDRLEHDKYLIFTRGTNGSFEALDSGAEVTILPLHYLKRFAHDGDKIGDVIEVLKDRRSERIDFDLIDGEDFQSLIYKLASRIEYMEPILEGGYHNDQGKDAFLKIKGRGMERAMVQAKKESSISDRDIEKMVRKAIRHDCEWCIAGILRATGDTMTEVGTGAFTRSNELQKLDVWQQEDIEEMLNDNLDLVKEYGLLPGLNSNPQ